MASYRIHLERISNHKGDNHVFAIPTLHHFSFSIPQTTCSARGTSISWPFMYVCMKVHSMDRPTGWLSSATQNRFRKTNKPGFWDLGRSGSREIWVRLAGLSSSRIWLGFRYARVCRRLGSHGLLLLLEWESLFQAKLTDIATLWLQL